MPPDRENWSHSAEVDFVIEVVRTAKILTRVHRIEGEDAVDLVQDFVVEAWDARHTFDASRAGLKTWLWKVIAPRVIGRRRRALNRSRALVPLVDAEGETRGCVEPEAPIGSDPAVAFQQAEYARSMLRSLAPDDAEILWWFGVEGLSHREISKRLGISEDAARARLHRARKRARRWCPTTHAEDGGN